MLLSSIAELVGTAFIMPFIALASSPDVTESNEYLKMLHRALGEPAHDEFLMLVGALFVGLVITGNSIMIFSQFLMSRYSFRVGGEISTRLYGYYLSRDMTFHSATNSAEMIQGVMRDSLLLSNALLTPALRINARVFSIVLLSALVVFVDPFVAINTVLVLAVAYLVIFNFVRRRVHANGLLISLLGRKRNQVLNESLGGIRDVKLYSYEAGYLRRYQRDTKRSDRAMADNSILGETPYFVIEAIMLAGMVLVTLYLLGSDDGLAGALPVLTLYGLAGLKIVPKVQQCYVALTKIRGAQAVFERLYVHLANSSEKNPFLVDSPDLITPTDSIRLEGVSYRYEGAANPVFNDLDVRFPAGKLSAITGSSGAGKTTMLEMLMGLLQPDTGCIAVDGRELVAADMPSWRASIAYVPQDVYLTDSSVLENIAFGDAPEDIDHERVLWAARLARVDDLVSAADDAPKVGERGSLLSGGQCQRIGIARALYKGVPLLFLDEATSALDEGTQDAVLSELKRLDPPLTTIMITHRRKTLAFADHVVQLGEGRSASEGDDS
ncbi:ABC transporter ATP-binding protein [Halioglobus japonicus]|nr:ABC transporter ATP-binding protein [Halioglobus japonicus]